MSTQNKKITIKELVLFSLLGTLIFLSKLLMDALPNIHPVAVLIMVYTIVFGKNALFPLYVYVFLVGLYGGFTVWWIPNLYIWTLLWGAAMLLPQGMGKGAKAAVYPLICALHGALYGSLCAPAQALLTGMSFNEMLAWITAGLPWDALHAAGNFVLGFLVLPLSELLQKLLKNSSQCI